MNSFLSFECDMDYIWISGALLTYWRLWKKSGSDLAHCGHGDDWRDGALWCERSHPPSANKHNSLISISQPLAVSLGHRKAVTQGSGFSRKFSPRWFAV